MKHDTGTECCLSLCQAVSFLPTAEEDEEMMMRKEDGRGRGKIQTPLREVVGTSIKIIHSFINK